MGVILGISENSGSDGETQIYMENDYNCMAIKHIIVMKANVTFLRPTIRKTNVNIQDIIKISIGNLF